MWVPGRYSSDLALLSWDTTCSFIVYFTSQPWAEVMRYDRDFSTVRNKSRAHRLERAIHGSVQRILQAQGRARAEWCEYNTSLLLVPEMHWAHSCSRAFLLRLTVPSAWNTPLWPCKLNIVSFLFCKIGAWLKLWLLKQPIHCCL